MPNGAWDLVIRGCRTSDSGPLVNVGIAGGKIGEVSDRPMEGKTKVEAEGRLLVPGFVNAHTHLDKADLIKYMTSQHFGGTLVQNRALLKELKANYKVEEIKERARKVALEMAAQGATAIRTQVDVDPTAGLTPMRAVLELKKELAAKVTIQVSSFPQEGVLGDKKLGLLEESLRMGADVLGGNPVVEEGYENQRKNIDALFKLAQKYSKPLDVQVDESNNPANFLLPYVAHRTIAEGYQGKVTATHCISLSAVDDDAARLAIAKVAEAQMSVIITPSCNLITQFILPKGMKSRPNNSITRVTELIAAGINVAIGTDNIRDIFYPLGNGSMLRELHTLATTTRMSGLQDVERLLQMSTVNGAKLLGLEYGVSPGKQADLMVLNGQSFREALCSVPLVPYVIKGGNVMATTAWATNQS